MQKAPTVFKLQAAIKKQLGQQSHYLLAVSGGADSLALAHACAVLGQQGWGRYSVCHVEHGLRGAESLQDMQLVQDFCRQYGLACYVEHVDVRACATKEHLSTEDAARRLRYAALRRCRQKCGAQYIVTAHHQGDQAETVLLRLLRGSGLEGLAAMRTQQGDILRPLLAVPKVQLEEYCACLGLVCAYDSTNTDTVYTRNRIRLELLPYLERCFNPSVVLSLAHTANLLAKDADCLEQLTQQSFAELSRCSGHSICLQAGGLLNLHPALRLRVLRKAYFTLGGGELSYERSQALADLCARQTGGKLVQLPGKITVLYKNKQLIFTLNTKI